MDLISQASEIVGKTKLARELGLKSRNTLAQWSANGSVPMTDFTGETNYSASIESLTDGIVSRFELLSARLSELNPGTVYYLPACFFTRDENQPRRQFDPQGLNELASSLKQNWETPIKARRVVNAIHNDFYFVIKNGERRYRAAEIAGILDIPFILEADDITLTPAERIFQQLADNTGQPLTPWDWVGTFVHLHDVEKLTDNQITNKLSESGITTFSRPKITNYRRLTNLPTSVQALIKSQWITPSHGKYLLGIKSDIVQIRVSDYLAEEYEQNNEAPSTADLNSIIASEYEASLNEITIDNEDKECTNCSYRHEINVSSSTTRSYCINATCFDEKQLQSNREEHQEQPKKEPKKRRAPAFSHSYENNQLKISLDGDSLVTWTPKDSPDRIAEEFQTAFEAGMKYAQSKK